MIVADSRGHGKSGLGTDHLTYIQMMEDLNALLDYLNITQANILGWSDGGILSLLLAINHPDKVSKMAVMGANLRPGHTAINSWVRGLLQPVSESVDDMIRNNDTTQDWQLARPKSDGNAQQEDQGALIHCCIAGPSPGLRTCNCEARREDAGIHVER